MKNISLLSAVVSLVVAFSLCICHFYHAVFFGFGVITIQNICKLQNAKRKRGRQHEKGERGKYNMQQVVKALRNICLGEETRYKVSTVREKCCLAMASVEGDRGRREGADR